MKLRHSIVVASAVLAISPVAMAGEVTQVAPEDCAALMQQYDETAAATTGEHASAAQAARDEGEKLCSEGRSAEGVAKLKEALSHIQQGAAPQPSS